MSKKQVEQKLNYLINLARVLGLSEPDLNNATEALSYNEYEVCFDTLITQMYEYNVKINRNFYNLTHEICEHLGIDRIKYHFINELLD